MKSAIQKARDLQTSKSLLVLADWCLRRAAGNHNERTTQTMLRRKVEELGEAVDRAGWLAGELERLEKNSAK